MVGSGLQTWQRGRQSGGSCGNDQSESPATKGPRRTYDVSRDRLTGCSSRGNVGLPRGWASCVVLARQLRAVEILGVALGFLERRVAKDGHDLVRGASGFRQLAA